MLIAGLVGVVTGLALGLLGAGGSILAVPALVYGVGQPLQAAIPGSLFVVAVSAAGGWLPRLRSGLIRWPVALVFGAAGIPAAFAGAAVSRLLADRWLLLALAVLMTVVAIRMLRGNPEGGGACRTRAGAVNWRSCLPKALATGAGVGVLTGLFGVGGGFVIVPALILLLGLTATEAVATSLVVITITSLAGLVAHASTATDLGVLAVFAAAALLASLLAGRLAHRLPASTMHCVFAYTILVVAAGIAVTAGLAPGVLPT